MVRVHVETSRLYLQVVLHLNSDYSAMNLAHFALKISFHFQRVNTSKHMHIEILPFADVLANDAIQTIGQQVDSLNLNFLYRNIS